MATTEMPETLGPSQEVLPGAAYPLGATWDGKGTNVAVFSENAAGMELCLFGGPDGNEEVARIPFRERTDQVWHLYVPELAPGQRYGLRAQGPYEPAQGHRFNPAKLLIDPYAKALDRDVTWDDAVFGYTIGHENADLARDDRDSARFVPKAVVVDTRFDWNGDDAERQRRRVWDGSPIYELHVKGMTARHPGVPPELRGTYAGLAAPAILDYLTGLGVTIVELMPVHAFLNDRWLADRGLMNYWGYNSIGYFAPERRYASAVGPGEAVREFKSMVRAYHQAGIEVILDVVYNHTAEGNHLGPTLSLRGLDNAAYYRLVAEDRRYYMDYTGCGNTLDMTHPRALQLIMDSLRYWIQEMHVDGFRFDLASALARELHEVDRLGAFFDIIQQDPVISRVKLIAEPWDLGEGGYQVGNFPPMWSEWNGKYRDCVRDYWRGVDQTLPELASRFTGSADLYEYTGRRPYASINFVTAHDGFTLHDLVSYNEKHNEANGDENRDGENHNRSWNCGVEGPTEEPEVLALRARQSRNFLATLFLSQGVPMLLHGDELGRTQQGNNNTYCQDNELTWIDWETADPELQEFTRRLMRLRAQHPVFRRARWFQGRHPEGRAVTDIEWFTPGGDRMSDEDWQSGFAKSLGIFLNGEGVASFDADGRQTVDDSFYVLANAHFEALEFRLPSVEWGRTWVKVLDTATGFETAETPARYDPGAAISVEARGLVLLCAPCVPEPERRTDTPEAAPQPQRIAIWAPAASSSVTVNAGGQSLSLSRDANGWWSAEGPTVAPDHPYTLAMDGGDPLPDPRSQWQPEGVHGPSRRVDHSRFAWTDAGFEAPPLAAGVVYEMHVGTFTPEGTFGAAIERLDHLAGLGITHLELMPVAAFDGGHGWGYDGVALHAPHAAYGTPDDLKRLVDACHARGMSVLVDVVYNHLGPSGNYLPRFGPYFTERYATPWGAAVNLDGAESDEVRRFLIDSARQWLVDYHADGLRLDAVHMIHDRSAVPFVEELTAEVHELARRSGRRLVVAAESDLNDPRVVRPVSEGGWGCDAQWSDDFHHALHALLTGESTGYYADFGGMAPLAKALQHAFVYDGVYSPARHRRHGRPRPEGLSGERFLGYAQTHDQIGNRAKGERLVHLVSPGRARIAAALVFASPFVPLLFQGEEWGATTPFLYFADHQEPALAAAITEGRRREFAAFGWNPDEVPDPQAPDTFARSKLRWEEREQEPHRELLEWHKSLIALRRQHPDLVNGDLAGVKVAYDEERGWFRMDRGTVSLAFNLGADGARVPLPATAHRVLLASSGAEIEGDELVLSADAVAIVANKAAT
jgi:glycogen operon protein